MISSEEGPQQGYPSWASFVLQHMNLGYLDDLTLGGPAHSFASDVAGIVQAECDMGLNTSKRELITHEGFMVTHNLLQSFPRTAIGDVSVFGASLFAGSILDKSWSDRCDDLARAVDRLCTISSQDVLILLRSSFSAPKVLHTSLTTLFTVCVTSSPSGL